MTQEQHQLARSHNLALRDLNQPEKGWRVIEATSSGRCHDFSEARRQERDRLEPTTGD